MSKRSALAALLLKHDKEGVTREQLDDEMAAIASALMSQGVLEGPPYKLTKIGKQLCVACETICHPRVVLGHAEGHVE